MPDLGLEVLLKGSNMLRLLQGLWVALRISLIAVVISIPLGLLFGVLMTRKNVVLKAIFRVYLEFIRIMPQLVLLFLFYFSTTRTFGWNLSGETASIIVFVLWGTAEMSDLVRGALISIPKHQYESSELPLPKYEVVAMLKSPRTQLIPFNFIKNFIRESPFRLANVHTYVKAIKHSTFYVPLYNIFLTVPFGMYLRYYFKKSKLDIIIYSFFLSLFFELTQLTGLYFIYPRGYRLFDVDDLILNTVGGLLGYFLVKPLMKILPTREEIDNNALKKGEKMSNLRKVTSFCLDLFIGNVKSLYTLLIIKCKAFCLKDLWCLV